MTSARQPRIHRVKHCLKKKEKERKGRRKDYKVCCTHYSIHDCERNLTKSNLRKEGRLWVTVQKDTVHRDEEDMIAMWSSWSLCILTQEATRDAWRCSTHFFLCIQCRILAHRMLSSIFRMDLPSSVTPLWKHPQQYGQRCVSYRVPNPIKLTRLAMTLGVVAFHLSTPKVESGRAEIQDKFHLLNEFDASLAYMRPCLKKRQQNKRFNHLYFQLFPSR